MNNSPMQDKETLQDLLSTQKFLTGNYNSFAGECSDEALRTDFLTILKEEHDIQNDLLCTMSSRGWYQTKNAEEKDVSAAKQKYMGSS